MPDVCASPNEFEPGPRWCRTCCASTASRCRRPSSATSQRRAPAVASTRTRTGPAAGLAGLCSSSQTRSCFRWGRDLITRACDACAGVGVRAGGQVSCWVDGRPDASIAKQSELVHFFPSLGVFSCARAPERPRLQEASSWMRDCLGRHRGADLVVPLKKVGLGRVGWRWRGYRHGRTLLGMSGRRQRVWCA